jgi:hypothetical protein
VGITEDNKIVVNGVYALYETKGLPFEVIFTGLKDKSIIPCWHTLVGDMRKAGIPDRKIFSMLQPSILFAYGRMVGGVIVERVLQLLHFGIV